MAKAKKGKTEVIFCTCPTCETHLAVDNEGTVLRAIYEEDEEKAKQKVKDDFDEASEDTDGDPGSRSKTISDPESVEDEKKGKEQDNGSSEKGFELGEGL